VEIEPMFAAEAKARQHKGRPKELEENLPQDKREPQARDQAAAVVGVSGKMVSDAKMIFCITIQTLFNATT